MYIKGLSIYFDTKVERVIKLLQSAHNIPIGSGQCITCISHSTEWKPLIA